MIFPILGAIIGSIGIGTVISAIVTIASIAYQRKQAKKLKSQLAALRDQSLGLRITATGSDQPIPICYGYTSTGGIRVFHDTNNDYDFNAAGTNGVSLSNGLTSDATGSKNEYLMTQTVLCFDGIDEIISFDVDDVPYDNSKFDNSIRCNAYRVGGTADPLATNNSSNRTTNATFTDLAFATSIYKIDREDPQFAGVPNTQFYVKGRRIKQLDINNAFSTPVFDNNAVYVLLDYLLNDTFGAGYDTDDIDLTSFRVAAEYAGQTAKANAAVKGRIYGDTDTTRNILRYEFNGNLDSSKPFAENIDLLMSSIPGASLFWSEGKWKIKIIDYTTSISTQTVATYTDDELMSGIVEIYPDSNERLNQVTVRFNNASKNFAEDSVTVPPTGGTLHNTYLTADLDIPLTDEIFLPSVSNVYSATAFAYSLVAQSRIKEYVFTLDQSAITLEPGDIITINSEHSDVDSLTLLVEEMNIEEDLTVKVQASEFALETYDFDEQDDEVIEDSVVIDFSVPNPTSLSAGVDSTTDASITPIVVSWTDADDAAVTEYEVEAKLASLSTYEWAGITKAGIESFTYQPNTVGSYDFRVKSKTFHGRLSTGATTTSASSVRQDLAASLSSQWTKQFITVSQDTDNDLVFTDSTASVALYLGDEKLELTTAATQPNSTWKITDTDISTGITAALGTADTDNDEYPVNVTALSGSTVKGDVTLTINYRNSDGDDTTVTAQIDVIRVVSGADGDDGQSSYTRFNNAALSADPGAPTGSNGTEGGWLTPAQSALSDDDPNWMAVTQFTPEGEVAEARVVDFLFSGTAGAQTDGAAEVQTITVATGTTASGSVGGTAEVQRITYSGNDTSEVVTGVNEVFAINIRDDVDAGDTDMSNSDFSTWTQVTQNISGSSRALLVNDDYYISGNAYDSDITNVGDLTTITGLGSSNANHVTWDSEGNNYWFAGGEENEVYHVDSNDLSTGASAVFFKGGSPVEIEDVFWTGTSLIVSYRSNQVYRAVGVPSGASDFSTVNTNSGTSGNALRVVTKSGTTVVQYHGNGWSTSTDDGATWTTTGSTMKTISGGIANRVNANGAVMFTLDGDDMAYTTTGHPDDLVEIASDTLAFIGGFITDDNNVYVVSTEGNGRLYQYDADSDTLTSIATDILTFAPNSNTAIQMYFHNGSAYTTVRTFAYGTDNAVSTWSGVITGSGFSDVSWSYTPAVGDTEDTIADGIRDAVIAAANAATDSEFTDDWTAGTSADVTIDSVAYRRAIINTNTEFNFGLDITYTANSGENGAVEVSGSTEGVSPSDNQTFDTITVSDPGGAQVLSATLLSQESADDVATRIENAIDDNAETPINFTAAVDAANNRIDITADEVGAVTGLWSVTYTSATDGDGDLVFNTATEVTAGEDATAGDSVNIIKPDGTTTEHSFVGTGTLDSDAIATEIKDFIDEDDDVTATVSDNVVTITYNSAGAVSGSDAVYATATNEAGDVDLFAGDVIDDNVTEGGISGTGADFRMTIWNASSGGARVLRADIDGDGGIPVGSILRFNSDNTLLAEVTGFRTSGTIAVVGLDTSPGTGWDSSPENDVSTGQSIDLQTSPAGSGLWEVEAEDGADSDFADADFTSAETTAGADSEGQASTYSVTIGGTTLTGTLDNSATAAETATALRTVINNTADYDAEVDDDTDTKVVATLAYNGSTPDISVSITPGTDTDDNAATIAVTKTVVTEGGAGSDLSTASWTYFTIGGVQGDPGQDGVDGTDGNTNAVVNIYRRLSSAPDTPSGGNYNFTTNVLTAPTDWHSSVPSGTTPVYISSGIASIVGVSGTDSSITWTDPVLAFQNGSDGSDGAAGFSYFEGYVYRRASSTPTTPTGGSYDFDSEVLTAPTDWDASIPSGSDPVYRSQATFSVQGNTGTDSDVTWSGPVVFVEDGTDGAAGKSIYSLALYMRSASTPSTPSGGSYNFGTEVVTLPTGWSSTIPSGTDTIYTSLATYSITGDTGTDTTPSYSTPTESLGDGADGTDGSDGNSVALLSIFMRATSAPNAPTGGSYNFTTNALTAPSSWSASVPSGSNPLYVSRGTASINGTTGSDTDITWGTPTILAQDGADGPAGATGNSGKSFFEGMIFQRAASQPTTPGNTSASFNFGTNTLTPPTGWSIGIPTGTLPIWSSTGLFEITGDTGTDTDTSWTTPRIIAQNGDDGTNGNDGAAGNSVFQASIFRRTNTAPSAPTGGSYNFGTNTITAPTNWSATIPSGDSDLYQTTGIFSIQGTSGTDTTTTWATPRKVTVAGPTGATGSRGAGRWHYRVGTSLASSYNDSEVTAFLASAVPGSDLDAPVVGDQLWLYASASAESANPTDQKVYIYRSDGWVEQSEVIIGDLIVDGTITTEKISADAITADEIQVSQSEADIYSTAPTSSTSGTAESDAAGLYFNSVHNRMEVWSGGELRVALGGLNHLPN